MGTIRIIGAPEDAQAKSKGIFTTVATQTVSEVGSKELQKNLNELVTELGGVLDGLNNRQGDGFKLKQFTVGVDISAKGGVSLVGKLEIGGKAAVSLVFERD